MLGSYLIPLLLSKGHTVVNLTTQKVRNGGEATGFINLSHTFFTFVFCKTNKMNTKNFSVSGNIVDLTNEVIFKGTVFVANNMISSIVKDETVKEKHYIMPGLIDSHIHIESSMLIPSEFARLAVVHGTVATVSESALPKLGQVGRDNNSDAVEGIVVMRKGEKGRTFVAAHKGRVALPRPLGPVQALGRLPDAGLPQDVQ